ncbi:MAG: glycosyltransferase family 4 protein [Anaerolineales bacterium]
MKIALVAPGPIPANTANSIQVMKMAQAVAGLGHTLRVFVPGEDPRLAWRALAAHYGLSGEFEIEWLPSHAWERGYGFTWRAVRAAGEWGADAIYTRLPQAAAIAGQRGQPTIFELHDMPSGTMGPWLLRLFLRSQGARKLVVNTKYLQEKIAARYPIPKQAEFIVLASNGVDLQRYAELPSPAAARKELGLGKMFTAGYTGHLYKGRGISFIIDLARRLPKILFLLVGGRDADVAARRHQAEGLLNVRFVGFVPNSDLPRYQAACDVLLMPYGRQVAGSSGSDIAAYTNPLKMFEYLAAGRPILTSDLPILREVLNEENAIILPDQDLESWVSALAGLQGSQTQRDALSAAARKTSAEYSWEKRAQRVFHGLNG